ncbi:MAG: hypothetical protein ACK4VY_08440 [Brevundimonas sp.]
MTDDEYIISQLAELAPGQPALVVLKSGLRCVVHDIAWGLDAEEASSHVTTNISPRREGREIDHFTTDQIAFIEIAGRKVFVAED